MADPDITPVPALAAALELARRIRENLDWLTREIDLNANISPDLAARIRADAGELARMAAARGN